jgi:hypothetical protein
LLSFFDDAQEKLGISAWAPARKKSRPAPAAPTPSDQFYFPSGLLNAEAWW